MTIVAVVDPAVTASPTARPTAATVPEIGLTIVAWLRACCATASCASAASTAAWSLIQVGRRDRRAAELTEAPAPDDGVDVVALAGLGSGRIDDSSSVARWSSSWS